MRQSVQFFAHPMGRFLVVDLGDGLPVDRDRERAVLDTEDRVDGYLSGSVTARTIPLLRIEADERALAAD